VDRCFLETLPTRLGPVEYRKYLDLGGGGAYGFQRPAERILLDRFTPIKHAFAGRNDLGEEPPEDVVELPETICERDNGNGGIRNGYMDMTWLVDPFEMIARCCEADTALMDSL